MPTCKNQRVINFIFTVFSQCVKKILTVNHKKLIDSMMYYKNTTEIKYKSTKKKLKNSTHNQTN